MYQVDLQTASIRPGDGASWRAALRERVRAEVASTNADVTIHVGNWYHDVRQVVPDAPTHLPALFDERTQVWLGICTSIEVWGQSRSVLVFTGLNLTSCWWSHDFGNQASLLLTEVHCCSKNDTKHQAQPLVLMHHVVCAG